MNEPVSTAVMMRLGIFGGTFDPIHIGHLLIVQELMLQLRLDRVLFLPSKNPPHKAPSEISSADDRLHMLRLAIVDNDAFGISLVDIERDGPSYTADSLEILKRQFPRASLHFLMGQDSLRDLPHWHDPERIIRSASLGVALRPGVIVDLAAIERHVPGVTERMTLVEVPLIQVSSTAIRERVRIGSPIRYHVPANVAGYIHRNNLYRV